MSTELFLSVPIFRLAKCLTHSNLINLKSLAFFFFIVPSVSFHTGFARLYVYYLYAGSCEATGCSWDILSSYMQEAPLAPCQTYTHAALWSCSLWQHIFSLSCALALLMFDVQYIIEPFCKSQPRPWCMKYKPFVVNISEGMRRCIRGRAVSFWEHGGGIVNVMKKQKRHSECLGFFFFIDFPPFFIKSHCVVLWNQIS